MSQRGSKKLSARNEATVQGDTNPTIPREISERSEFARKKIFVIKAEKEKYFQ